MWKGCCLPELQHKTRRCNIVKNEPLNHQVAVYAFLMSCLYSAIESFCYCFIKVPTITSVLHVPILLAYSFCNDLAENLMAEANFEMFVFSYCVSAPKAEDTQTAQVCLCVNSVTSAVEKILPKWCCIFSFYQWGRAIRRKMEMLCFGMMHIGYIAFFLVQ